MCYNEILMEISMSTTTIRLPDDFKTRIAVAAKRTGSTAHSFILDAIAEKIAQEEKLSNFNDLADTRYATIVSSGRTIPWDQMRGYLEDRLAGKKVSRPLPRKLAR